MRHNIIMYATFAFILSGLAACSGDTIDETTVNGQEKATPMTFDVTYPGQTRAADGSFEAGDRIGLFVANNTAKLEIGGNLVNNEAITCGNDGRWTAARTLYWDEGQYNAYAYYPYQQTISSISDQRFNVSTDQSTEKTATAMGGYEASDLLFASQEGVTASASPIQLTFKHIMSKITVNLIKGEDFQGEMPATAEVYILNTVPTATVDIESGEATRYLRGSTATIRARQTGNYAYSAIIVPQRIENRKPLIEVVMNGVSYLFTSKFVFKTGVEHLVNLVITENPDKVKIEIGGEIQGWKE